MSTGLIIAIVVVLIIVVIAVWWYMSTPAYANRALYIISPYNAAWDEWGTQVATYGHYQGLKQQFMFTSSGELMCLNNNKYVVVASDGFLRFSDSSSGFKWKFDKGIITVNDVPVGWIPAYAKTESGYMVAGSGDTAIIWKLVDAADGKQLG